MLDQVDGYNNTRALQDAPRRSNRGKRGMARVQHLTVVMAYGPVKTFEGSEVRRELKSGVDTIQNMMMKFSNERC